MENLFSFIHESLLKQVILFGLFLDWLVFLRGVLNLTKYGCGKK